MIIQSEGNERLLQATWHYNADRSMLDPASTVLMLPDTLTAVAPEAFMGTGSESIVLPGTCTSIGQRSFASCAVLRYVTIPASVTEIADDAFQSSYPTIIGAAGSTAESFAQEHGLPFIAR